MFTAMSEAIADKRRIQKLEKSIHILECELAEARTLVKLLREKVAIEDLPVGIDPLIAEWEK